MVMTGHAETTSVGPGSVAFPARVWRKKAPRQLTTSSRGITPQKGVRSALSAFALQLLGVQNGYDRKMHNRGD